jgi:Na+/H+ antiporter NhaD/arsenite permease-like protein
VGVSGAQELTLRAISASTVMFGGLTYIGNASNLMLRNVASRRGVRMPGFVPYMMFASAAMLPVLFVISVVFFPR